MGSHKLLALFVKILKKTAQLSKGRGGEVRRVLHVKV